MRFLAFIFILHSLPFFAQNKQEINPNGYNTFYHENGRKSSEGNMRDGKPDGYWKTYHPNGNIKSEGNRKNFVLDSIWVFYDEKGKRVNEYTYVNGKKNGIKKNYDPKAYYLSSEETYVEDVKHGPFMVYYKSGQLKQKTFFDKGKEEGVGLEFDTLGTLNSLVTYKFGFIARQERINRRDGNGWKQGIWKEFYPCPPQKNCDGKAPVPKREQRYLDDKPDGYLKEYALDGNLLNTAKFVNGKEIKNAPELAKIEIQKEYFEGGIVKSAGGYRNGEPEGIHRNYNEEGKVVASKTYKDGILAAEGIVDEEGRQQGPWKEFHSNGQLRAKGDYKDGKRVGEWQFFHPNSKTEQQGKYDAKGKAQGTWKWFYDNGQLLREEIYMNDLREGPCIEYGDSGKVITKGDYLDGLKEGTWVYELGDYREEGKYKSDRRDGVWKHYYTNTNKLRFEGNFIDGNPDGKHTYYYKDGKLQEEGKYVGGNKDKEWKYYDENGFLFLTIEYKDGAEIKYDGAKIRPTQEEILKGEIKK